MRIRYDLDALAARGISMEEHPQGRDGAGRPSARSAASAPQRQLYILETKGAEPTAAYFKPVVVAWRNGAPVRLQDVARVEDSVENEEARAEFNGQRSIIVAVERQPDANTVEVTDAVNAPIPQFQRLLPPTIKLQC